MRKTFGVLALIYGVFFAVCELWGTYEFLKADQQQINYIVLAGCGIAAAVALLPVWASLAWRGRRLLSMAIWILFVAALGTVMMAALSRTGTSTDTAQAERDSAGDVKRIALEEKKAADQAVAVAQEALDTARAELTEKSTEKTCLANCAAMLTANVASAQEQLTTAQNRQRSALEQTAAPPENKRDSLAARIAAYLPGAVTEDQVRLYQPAAVPVTTSALSAVLFALGVWLVSTPAAAHRSLWERLRRRRPADSDAAPVPLAAEASDGPARPLAALPPPVLSVEDFAATRFQPSPADLHVREAWRDYERLAGAGRAVPVELPEFLHALTRSGCQLRVDGRDVYLVGARLGPA